MHGSLVLNSIAPKKTRVVLSRLVQMRCMRGDWAEKLKFVYDATMEECKEMEKLSSEVDDLKDQINSAIQTKETNKLQYPAVNMLAYR